MNELRQLCNWVIFFLAPLLSLPAVTEQRIYQTDRYGNIQYQKPSLTVQDNGRVVETDHTATSSTTRMAIRLKATGFTRLTAMEISNTRSPHSPGSSLPTKPPQKIKPLRLLASGASI